jgi:hypothetical protein
MRRAILLLLLAAACGPKPDETRAERKLDTAASAPVPPTTSVLPTPTDSSITWDKMVRLVRAAPDSIRAVHQVHTRAVTVLFKDGRRYHATEPVIDEIIRLLKEVDPAGRVLIATE